jgi:peptide/nickel transport system substrate-binding protein
MRKRILLALSVAVLLVAGLGAEMIKRGGVVNATSNKQGVLAKNFNPFSAAALEATTGCLYEALIFVNQATATPNPWLAEKWTWAKDLKSITFTIRSGVKFSDGTPMTPDDVVFSCMLGKDNKALDNTGLWSEGLQSVVASGNKVTFAFKDVNVTALEKFGALYVVPKAIWSKVADPVNWTNGDNPVATGPFVVDPASFSEQAYKLVRNPNYWQKGADGKPLPYIDGVQYLVTTNEQVGFNLIADKYDWACYLLPNIDAYVQADPANHKYWFGEGNLVYLYMNNLKAPFDDINVRKAIAMGISQRDITRKMVPSPVPANQSAVKAGFASFAKAGMATYDIKRDVAKAKKILEAAGYKLNSKGIYEKNGQALSFKVVVPTDWTDWVGAAETIGGQLKEIGVETIVSQEAWPDPFQSNLQMGNTDMAFNISVTGSNPYYQFNRWLNSAGYAPIGTNNNTYWNMRYRDASIDKNLAAFRSEPDAKKQAAYMSAIIEQFMKDTPCVPLFFNPNWFEYSTKKFVGWPTAEDPYSWPSTATGGILGMQKGVIFLHLHQK